MTEPTLDLDAKIRALLARGAKASARSLALTWTQCSPAYPEAWIALSETIDEPLEAIRALEVALTYTPASLEILIRLIPLLVGSGRRAEGLERLDRATRSAPTSAASLDALGTLYCKLDQPHRAMPYFTAATRQSPNEPAYLFNLAACQRMAGELAGAIQSCERAIARKPDFAAAYYLRSDLDRARPGCNRTRDMEALLATRQLPRKDETFLHFALTKEYEDLGAFEQAFTHCKAGNLLQRRQVRYDVEVDLAIIDEIISTHTKSALESLEPGFPEAEPIFVLGLPRTGTTLVERILVSHSKVRFAGELQDWTLTLTRLLSRERTIKRDALDLVRHSLKINPRELGHDYVASVIGRQSARQTRFVDKMPLNYLYCGLIHAALPRAKIILLDRDPMDACYAIYKSLFVGAYPFSYDLADLGRYYVGFRRLIEHWLGTLAQSLLRVRYEDLALDFDQQVRHILEFCDLPLERACYEYHRSSAASTTASAVQARQPIYATSIGKWRHYESQLAPLATALVSAEIPLTF